MSNSDEERADLSQYRQRKEKKAALIPQSAQSQFFADMIKRIQDKDKHKFEVDLDGKQGGDFNIEF